MTGTARERSVYRYFDLADCFVQIVALEADAMTLSNRPGLGRSGYRKLVIEACMPDFRDDLDATLEGLFPDDPLMVEDLLYQLCVEINPSLDIHEVRLEVESVPAGSEAQSGAQTSHQHEERLIDLGKRCVGLERRLKHSILGQETAVRAVTRALKSAAAGLGEERQPLASFLFTGRTGTGKTELARVLASDVFQEGERQGLVRIDCSEFALAHEYSKLIGAPPGYVGHEDGGQLTDTISKYPDTVVLFDEIEKAHPKLHNLMLQILDDGALTDGKGRRVSFARSMIVMTSNCGAQDVQSASRAVGFHSTGSVDSASMADITDDALARTFSPEFLGRIGEIVYFQELDSDAVEAIAQKQLSSLESRAAQRGFRVRFTPAVARWVARRGFRPESGARELRRVVQREIEPRLSELLLAKGEATVRVKGGNLAFI